MQPATTPPSPQRFCRASILALIATLFLSATTRAADPAAYRAALASGKTKLEAGQVDAAWRDFQQAVQADGAQSEGYFYLAVASFRLGDHAAALEYANAAVTAANAQDKPRAEQLAEAIRKAKETDDLARQADEAQDNGLNAKAAELYARAFALSPDRGDLGLKAGTLYGKRLNRLLDAAVLFQGAIGSGDTLSADAAGAELGSLHAPLQQLYRDELPRAIARRDLAALVQLSKAFPIEIQPRIEVASLHAAKDDGSAVATWLGQAVKLGAGFDAIRERPAFLDLWGKNDAAFQTFIRDAFGPSAVSEMERRTKAHQAQQLEEHYKIKINTVKKHLLSGPFHLDMDAAAFSSLYESRLSSFKSDSAVVRGFQAEYARKNHGEPTSFQNGFVFPATAHGQERSLLDRDPFLLSFAFENPPLFDEMTDGKAVRALVDRLSDAGLKPFLGLNENWKLIYAGTERGKVDVLSFATTLRNVTDHQEVLKKLTGTFGSLQPFKEAPNGFLEYTADDALRGGRFLFPQANGITFDGRIFKANDHLVDSPWILELRVTRKPLAYSLFFEHHAVGAHVREYAKFSKRYAEQSVRETLQAAAGLKAVVAGRECILEKFAGAFTMQDVIDANTVTLVISARDIKTDEPVEVVYSTHALASAENIVRHQASDPTRASVYEVHLTQPAEMITRITTNGEVNESYTETTVIPFYTKDISPAPFEAVMAALPPPAKLTGNDEANRLARVFGYRGQLDGALFRYFKEANERGKFDDLLHLAQLAPDAQKPTYLVRAANAGNVRAMAELRMFYKEKWFDRKGTVQDRDQLFHWGAKAADAGDVESLEFMVDEARYTDLFATERRIKMLEAKGRWRGGDDLKREITQRANLARQLAPLAREEKAKAFRPVYEIASGSEIEGSAIGKKFKEYATPERQFSPIEKSYIDRSGKRVKLYQRGQPVHGGPQQVWVNRKGIIIGEYYLLNHGYGTKSTYEDELACLKQYFGAEHVLTDSSGTLKALAFVPNDAKTIQLLLFDKHVYLKYIDHTLE